MTRTPRRAALLLVAVILGTSAFHAPATAADQQKCVFVPSMYASGRPWTPEIPLCFPWPL